MAVSEEKISWLKKESGSLSEAMAEGRGREAQIVRTSIVGIVANVFLAAFKAAIGVISGSIAITLDAVNNLSDAASSAITIVGTKLAGRPADKKHPFGYGRIEYMTAMVISVIVLYAGATSLTESVQKILHPSAPSYTAVSLIIVAAGVLVKIVLGRYVKSRGKALNSDSLVNSGEDATLDSVISASTLVAAVIFLFFHVSLEAWLGAIISVVIIKSGLEMLGGTISQILGEQADVELARKIKAIILSYPGVSGVYDLVLNNYGPDVYNGSVHIEVPDTFSADQLDELIRRISVEVYCKCNVILTAVGVYALNTTDPEAVRMRREVVKLTSSVEHVLSMHGFHVDRQQRRLRFDLVISFDSDDRQATCREAVAKVQEAFPDYQLEVAMDTDFSEQ